MKDPLEYRLYYVNHKNRSIAKALCLFLSVLCFHYINMPYVNVFPRGIAELLAYTTVFHLQHQLCLVLLSACPQALALPHLLTMLLTLSLILLILLIMCLGDPNWLPHALTFM